MTSFPVKRPHYAHTHKGTPKGSRDRRSLQVTFHNVTSGQKTPLGRILRNFWLCMRTPKGTPKGSRDILSLPVAIVLVLLYYILYYYYSSSTKCTGCACRSGPVTSLPVSPPHSSSSNLTLSVPIYYLLVRYFCLYFVTNLFYDLNDNKYWIELFFTDQRYEGCL